MDTLNALKQADDVRTFPSIDMPVPVVRKPKGDNRKHKTVSMTKRSVEKDMLEDQDLFPGMLKTGKTKLLDNNFSNVNNNVAAGFNSTHLKLDVALSAQRTTADVKGIQSSDVGATQKGLSQIDLANTIPVPVTERSPEPTIKSVAKVDPTLDELRNYIVLMDKYSLHNFMIYNGETLRDTPEFQSFKRTYNHKWGAIMNIVRQLEGFLSKHGIKLAIINGPAVFELSKLNTAELSKPDIRTCIANIDQVEMFMETNDVTGNEKQLLTSVIKIQSLCRRHIALKRYKIRRKQMICVVDIQKCARGMIYRNRVKAKLKAEGASSDTTWDDNCARLQDWWHLNSGSNAEGARHRLIVYVPSISISEYLRLDCDNFHALQNAHIANLYQLSDPDLTIIYVTPSSMGSYEMSYHEKLLSLLGVSILPKRLHFVTPEMINRLPTHLSLAQALWCSPAALNRIRTFLHHSRFSMLVPATLGWVERRIANYLNVPLMSADPSISETISSRSYTKKIFMDTAVNIPIGAHDIYSGDDLMIALSRLIASNIGVERWLVRLNYDSNGESTVYLDVNKLPIVGQLRREQLEMAGDLHNIGAWFTRQMQLSVRKRIITSLKKDLAGKVRICRRDIFSSWAMFLKLLKNIGAVIEAEPLEKLGRVDGLCFISPYGDIENVQGVEVGIDDRYQAQWHTYPQDLTPQSALEGATTAVATMLHQHYHVIGFVTISFLSFWDPQNGIPRLWGTGIKLGMTPVFGALGTAAVVTQRSNSIYRLPFSLSPRVPEGKYCVYIPIAVHSPLRSSQDDVFFKMCKMRGIGFDVEQSIGTLFFLVDAIVGGAVSMLCVADTRKKAIGTAIHTLEFVSNQFGKDSTTDIRYYDNLTSILVNMKKLAKHEEKQHIAAVTAATQATAAALNKGNNTPFLPPPGSRGNSRGKT